MAIVRTSEVYIIDGKVPEFMAELHNLVATFPATYDGLEHHEVLVDRAEPRRLIYRSRWRDEAALVAFAGPDWETEPVRFPGEEDLLVDGMHLRHFAVDPGIEPV
ncbi:MAG: antibiotic biosynthesis monooxygenase [Pseudolysinimonas sp.]